MPEDATLEMDYVLTGSGWAECTVRTDGKWATVTASYLGDALGDLACAVLALVAGAERAEAGFQEEPGLYRWTFARLPGDRVALHLTEVVQDGHGERLLFEVVCPLVTLVAATVRCLDDVFDRYGFDGYRERWMEHDFPTCVHMQLRAILEHLQTRNDANEDQDHSRHDRPAP